MTDPQPPLPPPPPPQPLPPPAPSSDVLPTEPLAHSPRVGDLSPQWRIAMLMTWAMAFMSYMAVWKASEELGIGTWWLGPRSNPQPTIVSLIPFAIVALVGAAASFNIRRLPWIGIGGSVALWLVAIPDLSRSTGLAVVEFAIAGATLVVAIASLTGTYRVSSKVATEPGR